MLKGQNLSLRLVEQRDLETLRYWRMSPEVSRFFDDTRQISEAQQQLWFEKVSIDSSSHYFVIEKDDEIIGACNLSNTNWIHRNATWGIYMLPNRQQGFLPVEAAILILDYGFQSLHLNKIYGDVLAKNNRALEFNRGLGFQEEGVRKSHVFHDGKYEDVVLIGLFKEEYQKATSDFRKVIFKKGPINGN